MFERILIGVDFSESSERALEMARLQFPAAQRRLVYVAETKPAMPSALDLLEGADAAGDAQRGRIHLDALRADGETVCVVEGHPAQTLLAEAGAWRADLIVVGTQGRRGLAHLLLGSVAEGVIRAATVPVLTVRQLEARADDP